MKGHSAYVVRKILKTFLYFKRSIQANELYSGSEKTLPLSIRHDVMYEYLSCKQDHENSSVENGYWITDNGFPQIRFSFVSSRQ